MGVTTVELVVPQIMSPDPDVVVPDAPPPGVDAPSEIAANTSSRGSSSHTSSGAATSSSGSCFDHQRLFQLLGPGIMFSTTAVGVSHLVQCTRSGATYGWANTWAVIAAFAFKYPFFEFAARYANVTGNSLVDGYKSLGGLAVYSLACYMVVSSPIITAAVGVTTAAFVDNLFALGSHGLFGPNSTALVLYTACALLLLSGRSTILDALIKAITFLLVVCTLAALVGAVSVGESDPFLDTAMSASLNVTAASTRASPNATAASNAEGGPTRFGGGNATETDANAWDVEGIRFLIALLGWMPVPMDTGSIASSLWSIERHSTTGLKPTLRESICEFAFGYFLTAWLAIAFLALAVLLLHESGEALPDGSAALAAAVVGLYSRSLGQWAVPVIGVAASCAMLGTLITILDCYMRILMRLTQIVARPLIVARLGGSAPSPPHPTHRTRAEGLLAAGALLYVTAAAFALQALYPGGLRALVDLATTVSFVVAPAVAAINTRLVTRPAFPKRARPPLWLRALAGAGLAFLGGFTVVYAWTLSV